MDPQSATDYDDRGATAVVAVLLEIGQVLGGFRDRFVVIGGSVPWLLYPNAEPKHVGTLDVDLSLDTEALSDDDYTSLVDALERAGYERSSDGLRRFQLRRMISVDDGEPVAVIVDLLMPREVKLTKHKPPLIASTSRRVSSPVVQALSLTRVVIFLTTPSPSPATSTLPRSSRRTTPSVRRQFACSSNSLQPSEI